MDVSKTNHQLKTTKFKVRPQFQISSSMLTQLVWTWKTWLNKEFLSSSKTTFNNHQYQDRRINLQIKIRSKRQIQS